LLVRVRNIDDVNHRLALAVHPGARESEVRPIAVLELQNFLVESNGVGEFPGPDVVMIEQAYAHGYRSLGFEVLTVSGVF
jgi:hypothetical protein